MLRNVSSLLPETLPGGQTGLLKSAGEQAQVPATLWGAGRGPSLVRPNFPVVASLNSFQQGASG